MLFRFRSKASPDLVMLESHARHILEMMGKEAVEKGIVCHEELPSALLRLEQSLLALKHDRNHVQPESSTEETSLKDPTHDDVSWSQRAQPMLKMMRLALVDKASITWGA